MSREEGRGGWRDEAQWAEVKHVTGSIYMDSFDRSAWCRKRKSVWCRPVGGGVAGEDSSLPRPPPRCGLFVARWGHSLAVWNQNRPTRWNVKTWASFVCLLPSELDSCLGNVWTYLPTSIVCYIPLQMWLAYTYCTSTDTHLHLSVARHRQIPSLWYSCCLHFIRAPTISTSVCIEMQFLTFLF